jgi:hypothetical protein
MANKMRRRTFLQKLRDLARAETSTVQPEREKSRSYTKAGPGRMPYRRSA